jgi:S1-C subfamily serine protease
MEIIMLGLVLLALVPGQFPIVASKEFPPEVQQAALAATVRIENRTQRINGTGAIVGIDGPFIYILTAGHVVKDGGHLEVATFTAESYPKAKHVFRTVTVVAESQGVKDLALLRIVAAEKLAAPLPFYPPPRQLKKERFVALTVGCGNGDAPTCQLENVVGDKIVSRAGRPETGNCWEVAQPQTPGRSGGPMLDRRGRLIGICSGNNGARGYFCHISEIEDFLISHHFRSLLAPPKK